eukprot:TRINITY_DN926_c0_g2_i1.p1 TRINITY_DN926_c0_g2~~TRINITY_DN926_c0_g2_i1.p1  ORF type:complete len:310 (-),score=95.88 TRINITY_DN926_c0_g2_i1:802-1731(-)
MKTDENEALLINSVCISIENFKLIYELLTNNKEDVMKIKKQILKYIDRIDSFMESTNSTVFVNPFEPREPFFKYHCVETNAKVSPEEFKDALRYVIMQKVTSRCLNPVQLQLTKWQHCLVKILLETNLTSFCQRVEVTSEIRSKGESMLVELFRQMHKCPREYLLSANKEGQVRVMGYYLVKYFLQADTKNVVDELDRLKEVYIKDTADILAQQQKIEQSLRLHINSLGNKASVILNEIKENDSDVFECTLARKFVLQYKCAYEIKKHLAGKSINKAKLTESKYVILFQDNSKKGKKPKVEMKVSTLSE